ncbi:MAG: hypothetical protein ABSA65_06455 [Acidimicrobiales bacterium]
MPAAERAELLQSARDAAQQCRQARNYVVAASIADLAKTAGAMLSIV